MEKKSKAWGISSLVCGIVSLLLFLMPYFGLPLAIMAVVGAAKQKKIQGNGISAAGHVVGIVGIVINGIMLFFVLIGLLFLGGLASAGLA